MDALPELGVGTIWFAGLDHLIEASAPVVDFLEVEPATMAHPDASDPVLDHLANDERPTVVHGVAAPIGGTIAPAAGFSVLSSAADQLDAPWVSEHLSINRLQYPDGSDHHTGFFLPPIQTPETVELVASNLRQLRQISGRPVAFETGVNYLQPQPGEMSDGAFWAAVADAADCFILCDLHNLWCNEFNGRQPMNQVINELPLERICEIHLAAGNEQNGYLLDAHSGLVDAALMEQAGQIIERLPALRALTFEMMPAYIPAAQMDEAAYRAQFDALQRLWERRGRKYQPGSATRIPATSRGPSRAGSPFTVEAWEAALGHSLGQTSHPGAATINDPGIELYRYLIRKMRSGAIVSAAPLSYRMLALSLGLDAANQLLFDYQRDTPPSLLILDEGAGFADYLADTAPAVPYLLDVVNFEATAHGVMLSGEAVEVDFGCDPGPLLDALRAGSLPDTIDARPHRVLVEA